MCDVCGGPEQWTIYAGVTFVRCTICPPEQLTLEGFDLPTDSEDAGHDFSRDVMGTSRGGEGVPLEGSEANGSVTKYPELPF